MEGTQKPVRHNVVVYIDHHSAKIFPGRIVVAPGDTISFETLEVDAQLFLPQITRYADLSQDRTIEVGDQRSAILQLTRDQREVIIISDDAEPGRYPYAAYCTNMKAFAVGDSDPTIIIRKRDE